MTTDERLACVERQLRRTRVVVASGALVIAACALVGALAPSTTQDVVTARTFLLVDGENELLGAWSPSGGETGSRFEMYDSKGDVRVFGLATPERSGVTVFDSHMLPRAMLSVDRRILEESEGRARFTSHCTVGKFEGGPTASMVAREGTADEGGYMVPVVKVSHGPGPLGGEVHMAATAIGADLSLLHNGQMMAGMTAHTAAAVKAGKVVTMDSEGRETGSMP